MTTLRLNSRVYPRPRGGAWTPANSAELAAGLSPPTRGSPDPPPGRSAGRRSIPAHAGEPRPRTPAPFSLQVYPRPRGGAAVRIVPVSISGGLSPPTRGSRLERLGLVDQERSIPAHAGEPDTALAPAPATAVYPRPRGGATLEFSMKSSEAGLSPPTRGSLGVTDAPLVPARSIPAHAGEPYPTPGCSRRERVYPRPRGGAAGDRAGAPRSRGLSPPTRGSLVRRPLVLEHEGSIPAHAGEPRPTATSTRSSGVYPRPRGGAIPVTVARLAERGLSPPTRGSRQRHRSTPPTERSIPAHAGEPPTARCSCPRATVYPRPRGGAELMRKYTSQSEGLSPPTRGSQGAA